MDWKGLDEAVQLATTIYQTDMAYDALNRARHITLPTPDIDTRKTLTPTYNRAGGMHKLKLDDTEYIREIAYNAKGQRLLMVNGNNTMTRYDYREDNFRLKQIRTEKYTQSGNTYTPVADTQTQNLSYHYDLKGNNIILGEELQDVGINGSPLGVDAIEKLFSYDPINRLRSATGRESNSQTNSDFWNEKPIAGNPNAQNTRAYTRSYDYDKVGNIKTLKSCPNNGECFIQLLSFALQYF